MVYYFTSAVAAGAPARAVDFVVPTGNFGDIFAGYVAKRMGLPVRTLRIAANVNDILARTLKTGIYEVREVHATASPSMDIQISSNFERLLFEAGRRDAAGVRRLMDSLKQSGRFVLPDATLAAIREEFDAGRADETETAAAIRAAWREAGELVDPHTAVALAVADRDTTDTTVPSIVLSTAHPAKFPDAVEAACGQRPQLPAWLDGLMTKSEHMKVMKNDQAEVERFVLSVSRAAKTGSCRMSVEISKLASGLTVVTDKMPHLETAALGVWAGVGGRDEKPNEHGISHLLEHMAFKGTTKRSSREIVEEIEAVGGDLNAGTSTETTSYYARGAEGRRAAGARRARRHPGQSRLRARRAGAREERHRAGDRCRAGHARRRRVRASQRALLSRPADGPLAARHRQDAARLQPRHAARLSVDALSRARHGGGGRRRGRSQPGGRRGREALCKL
ncbi:hypothetical protein BRDID11002_34770 [Bradyrhizobium diazoefficiens]